MNNHKDMHVLADELAEAVERYRSRTLCDGSGVITQSTPDGPEQTACPICVACAS